MAPVQPGQPATVRIPDDLEFSALKLSRDQRTGDVEFDWQPIERICEANGIDVDLFRRGPEDNLSGLLAAWYSEHLDRGGARDACMDDLIAEAAAEDQHGGGFSHPPGRA